MDALIDKKVIKEIKTSKRESTNELKIDTESVISQAVNLIRTSVRAAAIAKKLADKLSISSFFITPIYFS
jgi:hypothetical protein